MSAPSSLARVLGLLQRLSPTWPSSDTDTSVGKELGSIAVPLGMAADAVDSVQDEVLPDTTTLLLSRWEGVTNVPSRPSDSLDFRRARVLSVLRRAAGPRIDQLGKVLAAPFDLDENQVVFVEQLRQTIDAATTLTSPTLNAPTPCTPAMQSYFPGTVDDTGVRIIIEMAVPGAYAEFTLRSPTGIPVSFTQLAGDGPHAYVGRTEFLGVAAAGTWTLTVTDTTPGQALVSWALTISNSVDSGGIYNFFAFRDPTLGGTPDLVEAQRLLSGTALAQMVARVGQSLSFRCDDPYSLCDRDPMGV